MKKGCFFCPESAKMGCFSKLHISMDVDIFGRKCRESGVQGVGVKSQCVIYIICWLTCALWRQRVLINTVILSQNSLQVRQLCTHEPIRYFILVSWYWTPEHQTYTNAVRILKNWPQLSELGFGRKCFKIWQTVRLLCCRDACLTPTWVNNHIPSKVWDEITYPFPNLNGCTVEVWG